MTSNRGLLVLLIVALLQAAVAGGVAIAHRDPAPTLEAGTTGRGSAPPTVGSTPGEDMGVPPAAEADGATGDAPAGAEATPSPAPAGEKPGSAEPPVAKALRIYDTYEKLTPEEGARLDSGPTFTAVIEGRVSHGSLWRLSARAQPVDKLCLELTQWDRRTESGSAAGGGREDKDGWGFLLA